MRPAVQEAVLTKAYAVRSTFEGADMTNAVVDRVDFSGANMRGVKFVNAVITGAVFEGTDLAGADFEDALIGNEDVKRLCAPVSGMFYLFVFVCTNGVNLRPRSAAALRG